MNLLTIYFLHWHFCDTWPRLVTKSVCFVFTRWISIIGYFSLYVYHFFGKHWRLPFVMTSTLQSFNPVGLVMKDQQILREVNCSLLRLWRAIKQIISSISNFDYLSLLKISELMKRILINMFVNASEKGYHKDFTRNNYKMQKVSRYGKIYSQLKKSFWLNETSGNMLTESTSLLLCYVVIINFTCWRKDNTTQLLNWQVPKTTFLSDHYITTVKFIQRVQRLTLNRVKCFSNYKLWSIRFNWVSVLWVIHI